MQLSKDSARVLPTQRLGTLPVFRLVVVPVHIAAESGTVGVFGVIGRPGCVVCHLSNHRPESVKQDNTESLTRRRSAARAAARAAARTPAALTLALAGPAPLRGDRLR